MRKRGEEVLTSNIAKLCIDFHHCNCKSNITTKLEHQKKYDIVHSSTSRIMEVQPNINLIIGETTDEGINNDTDNMSFEKIVDDLSYEKDAVKESDATGSPYVHVKLENWDYGCLLDTGSLICGISEQLEEICQNTDFVELPVAGVKLKSTTGRYSQVVKSQVLLTFTVKSVKFILGCLVIPDLNEIIFIGVD